MLLRSHEELNSPRRVPVRWGSSMISSTQEENWGPRRQSKCLEGHHGCQQQVAVGTACGLWGNWACGAGQCPRAGRAAWRLLRSHQWKGKGKSVLAGAPEMALSKVCWSDLYNVADVHDKAEICSWGIVQHKKISHCINHFILEMENWNTEK